MQLDVARLENHRWKMRIKKKMDDIDGEIEKWVAENGLPSNKKSDIMAKVEVEFKENRNVVVEDIMSILPSDLQTYVNNCMPLNRLRKVSRLESRHVFQLDHPSVNLFFLTFVILSSVSNLRCHYFKMWMRQY